MSRIAALFLTASAIAISSGASASGAEATLKAISGLVKNNPLTESFVANYVKPVNKECKGVVQIDYVGGPEIVPPRNSGKAIANGEFDMLNGPTSYYAGTMPEGYAMLASNVPIEELHKNGGYALLDSIYQKRVKAKFVAWGDNDVGYYAYLRDKPKLGKDGVPDLHGLKMRASATYRPFFNALGASTINMRETEIYTALERGVVDGFGWPVTGVPELGLDKLIKYVIHPSFYKTNQVVTMNFPKWKSLSKAQQDCLNKVAREYEKDWRPYMTKFEKDDAAAMAKHGVNTFTLKGAAAKKYLKIAYDAIWAELKKKSPDADKLRALLYSEKYIKQD
jgi:TRAP-type C4-dicarboxylate transport system substrate-binding protein